VSGHDLAVSKLLYPSSTLRLALSRADGEVREISGKMRPRSPRGL